MCSQSVGKLLCKVLGFSELQNIDRALTDDANKTGIASWRKQMPFWGVFGVFFLFFRGSGSERPSVLILACSWVRLACSLMSVRWLCGNVQRNSSFVCCQNFLLWRKIKRFKTLSCVRTWNSTWKRQKRLRWAENALFGYSWGCFRATKAYKVARSAAPRSGCFS